MIANTLFGAPLGYTADSLDIWISRLRGIWTDFADRRPGELSGDLRLLANAFDSGTSPAKLREVINNMAEANELDFVFPDEVVYVIQGTALITPEGRILLDVLETLRFSDERVISAGAQISALELAWQVRADSHRRWMYKQVQGSVGPAVLAGAVLLLVNGSIGASHAFNLPNATSEDRKLAGYIQPIIGVFCEALRQKSPDFDVPLQSHWVFSQLSRRFGRDIGREKSGTGSKLYVREHRQNHLIDDIRSRMAKFHADDLAHAVESLVHRYRVDRGLFISLGMGYEDPIQTEAIVRSLISRQGEHFV